MGLQRRVLLRRARLRLPRLTSGKTSSARGPLRRAVLLGIAAALLSWWAVAPAVAQRTGVIEGAVVDANGNSLPGVVVTVTGRGVRQEDVNGADGS